MPVLQPIRYFERNELYNYIVDNRPLQDLHAGLTVVNAAVDALLVTLTEAKGDADTLAGRLQHLDADGVLEEDGLPEHSIAGHSDSDGYVRMTDEERSKLALVEDRANVFRLHVGEPTPDPLVGEVVVQGGRSVVVTVVPTSSDKRLVRIDTAFPPDRIHEHRYCVKVFKIDGSTAYVPSGETYVPGTLLVHLNGVVLGPSNFAEVHPYDRFSVFLDRQIDLAKDEVLVSYEVRPSWDLLASDPLLSGVGKPFSIRWIRGQSVGDGDNATKRSVTYELESGSSYTDDVWMIDVSGYSFVSPFEKFRLYLNGILVHYGCDWDLVPHEGRTWLRWRYPNDVSASPYLREWMGETFEDFATHDLESGDELHLDAYVAWS